MNKAKQKKTIKNIIHTYEDTGNAGILLTKNDDGSFHFLHIPLEDDINPSQYRARPFYLTLTTDVVRELQAEGYVLSHVRHWWFLGTAEVTAD